MVLDLLRSAEFEVALLRVLRKLEQQWMRERQLRQRSVLESGRLGAMRVGACNVTTRARHLAIAAGGVALVLGTLGAIALALPASAAAPLGGCPVTHPNGRNPPGTRESSLFHGNGRLFTSLPPRGVFETAPEMISATGTIRLKFPWWRAVHGRLHLTGWRYGRKAQSIRTQVPDGYGLDGFQATSLFFRGPGCWVVNGRVGADASMRFIIQVAIPSR